MNTEDKILGFNGESAKTKGHIILNFDLMEKIMTTYHRLTYLAYPTQLEYMQ